MLQIRHKLRAKLYTCGTASAAALAAALLAAATFAPAAVAQAVNTASKTMDISIFGGYDYLKPDYGPSHNNGVTVGANFTRYFRFPIKPSLETRFSFNNGSTVNENTYLAGVRGQMEFGRFHPYADFLLGDGTIHYNFVVNLGNPTAYRNDNSLVKSPGVGIDVDLLRNFQVKADYQYQFWYLGKNDSLSPSAITVGVAYRIPFKPRYEHAVH
jgi:opacity protein-like surface antigen